MQELLIIKALNMVKAKVTSFLNFFAG